jgi:RNA polymerase sigma-70 factor (ECF subfamily)
VTDLPTRPVTETDWLAERFEDHRPHLRAVAYRMLGSMTEADDAVQDAWLRLSRSEASRIDNLGGWLTTVVARLCLDALRARAARREELAGDVLPEPVVTTADESIRAAAADPEHQALLADSVGLAMLVVLETLTPAERLAFVLHDTFGLPFEEVAPIVDRSPTATRQLASRARRRVRGADAASSVAGSDVSPARQRELVNAFLAAARAGDFDALLRSSTLTSSSGGTPPPRKRRSGVVAWCAAPRWRPGRHCRSAGSPQARGRPWSTAPPAWWSSPVGGPSPCWASALAKPGSPRSTST